MSLVKNKEIIVNQVETVVENKAIISLKTQGNETTNQPKPGGENIIFSFLPFIVIAFAFYFLIIRPQNKKQNELKDKISKVKKDDRVLTAGGIIGTVDRVDESEVVLKVDDKTKLTFTKSSIVDILSNVVKA